MARSSRDPGPRMARLVESRTKKQALIAREKDAGRRKRLEANLAQIEASIRSIEETGREVQPTGNPLGAEVKLG